MATTDPGTAVSRAVFAPALGLILAVVLLMQTARYDVVGLYTIFAGFIAGIALTVAAVLRFPRRIAGQLFRLGGSLTAAAVGLYLVYGCVFGCPG